MTKGFFAPAVAWKYLAKKPITICVPKEERPAAPRYRGFHTNDIEKCIGCGTCGSICPTEAIHMVEVDLPSEPGNFNRRPAIDYGRCSFCALCVDICTTGSLKMTREYVHIDPDPESFFFIPEEKGIHSREMEEGYARDESSDLLELQRVVMSLLDAKNRVKSFVEMVQGYSKEQAQHEASRCVDCSLCREACPANMHIPQYIEAIWKGNEQQAAREIYRTNPLPEVCGRVCTHNCETACSIGNRGEPVAIRWLKRYALDAVEPSSLARVLKFDTAIEKNGKKVAIVGAGPAGLAAAYFLAPMGYQVTIFEKQDKAGGVMRYGIPAYRLPDEALDRDIAVVESLGVEIRTGVEVGKNLSLDQLKNSYKYDAVLLAVGFSATRSTQIPGSEHPQVQQALEFLAQVRDWVRNPRGQVPRVESRLIVIGGGNVAFDVARSAARIQKFQYGKVDVRLVSLESREIMPADLEEIEEGQEEGIQILNSYGPRKIEIQEDRIKGVSLVKCLSVFDENKRFNPTFDENDARFLEGNGVVEAIGQAPDYSLLPEHLQKELEIVRGRFIASEDGQTSVPWLFVAGDILNGPDIIHGVADGHRAAQGIDEFLGKEAEAPKKK